MGCFKKKLTINKDEFERVRKIPLSKSLEDAFNHELSRFDNNEPVFGSELYQKLTNEGGDVSYFDHFMGITSANKNGIIQGIYCIGPNETDLHKVTMIYDMIIDEKYDFNNDTATVTLSKVNEEYWQEIFVDMKIPRSRYVKSLVWEEQGYESSLDFLGGLKIQKVHIGDIDAIVCNDWDGTTISSDKASGNSFYTECVNRFNYYDMLLSRSEEKGRQYKKEKN